jgi:hypothetical protein
MKRILLIFALTISLVACSQTQTFTGVKTFTSPPKFQNLIQNDLNTKMLSINSTGVLQYRNASTFAQDSNVVHKTNAENIDGVKTFSAIPVFQQGIKLDATSSKIDYGIGTGFSFTEDGNSLFTIGAGTTVFGNYTGNTGLKFNYSNATALRDINWRDASGTVAFLSDIPATPQFKRYVASLYLNADGTVQETVLENTLGEQMLFFKQNVGEWILYTNSSSSGIGNMPFMNVKLTSVSLGDEPRLLEYGNGGGGPAIKIISYAFTSGMPIKKNYAGGGRIEVEITIYP